MDDLEKIRTRVQALYTPAISDMLDNAGYRNQAARSDLIPLVPGTRIAGPVFPILAGPVRWEDDPRRPGMAAIESFTPGVVACYDSNGNTDAAAWGEFWTSSAQVRGCVGAIIDGGIRDAARMRERGFATFYRFRTPVDARGRMRVMDYDVQVTIGGVTVRPGDYVVADDDGVVFIPGELLDDVVTAAERYVADEDAMRVRLDAGERPKNLLDEYGHF